MSDKKLQKEYVDHGFGFPIRLRNVPMVKVRRTWTPDLNYEALAVAVLKALCFKPVRLTGNEIRFIRLNATMTLQKLHVAKVHNSIINTLFENLLQTT